MNALHFEPPYFYKIHFNIIFPCSLNSLNFFSSRLFNQSFQLTSPYPSHPLRALCLIPFDISIQIAFGEVYKGTRVQGNKLLNWRNIAD